MFIVSRWISRVEAAELLGISPSGVGWLIRNGELTPRRMRSRQSPSLDERQVRELAARRLVEDQRARDRAAEAVLRTRHPQDGHDWWTAREVSRLLGISRVRVDQLARRGSLPFQVAPGGRRSFRADHVELVRHARNAAQAGRSGGAAGDEAGA
jgi:predicted site-specific integrase-resolvase